MKCKAPRASLRRQRSNAVNLHSNPRREVLPVGRELHRPKIDRWMSVEKSLDPLSPEVIRRTSIEARGRQPHAEAVFRHRSSDCCYRCLHRILMGDAQHIGIADEIKPFSWIIGKLQQFPREAT